MSRYLTPSKLGLLALVWLYSTSGSGNSGFEEFGRSANVPIVSFIISNVLPKPLRSARENPSKSTAHKPTLELSDFEKVLKECTTGGLPGRTCWDIFLEKIWRDFSCLDDLHNFFKFLLYDVFEPTEEEQIERLNDRAFIDRAPIKGVRFARISPLGLFVRRAHLEFTRLQFDDAVRLWDSFVRYREPSRAAWRKRSQNGHLASDHFDIAIQQLSLAADDRLTNKVYGHLGGSSKVEDVMSTDEVERFLEHQVEQLQRYGNRMPEGVKQQFRSILSSNIAVPSLSHFVKFFDAWRAGDYTTSLDNLHRYFDYTMQTRDKSYYQYALLHKAVLQADFGCFGEAFATMQETIAAARENHDTSCLNFSTSWLQHLKKAHPAETKEADCGGVLQSDLVNFLSLWKRARETNQWSLLSSTLLSLAKLVLSHVSFELLTLNIVADLWSKGESMPAAFLLIHESSRLNLQHSISSVTGAQMLMNSSVSSRLGISELAKQQALLFKQCYADNAPLEEILRMTCRQAYLSAHAGNYDEAMTILSEIGPEVQKTLKFDHYVRSYHGILKLKRQLHKNNITAASHILRELKSASPLDSELSFELFLLEVRLLERQNQLSKAFDLIEDYAEDLQGGADIYQHIRLMSSKARLFIAAGKPNLGFSLTMRAASASLRAKILPALWEAIANLCHILVALGECRASLSLLDAIIPQALEGGDAMLCAMLFSAQADAYLGLAATNTQLGSLERVKHLGETGICLERALEWYRRVEDHLGELDMLFKQAHILRLRGDTQAANAKAEEYVHVHDAAKASMEEDFGTDSRYTPLRR
ncbi:MAG: anaphase promoting complex subunit 5 [Bogoriella megaspora]|nr:MAG: anaphase promoting complex subunit 5 [Bogoriella megaspora]